MYVATMLRSVPSAHVNMMNMLPARCSSRDTAPSIYNMTVALGLTAYPCYAASSPAFFAHCPDKWQRFVQNSPLMWQD